MKKTLNITNACDKTDLENGLGHDPEEHLKGFTLSWSNLSYSIKTDNDGNKKMILADLDGILDSGSLLACLGASGAGKSTFLDVLAGRKPSSQVSGEVRVNGRTDIPIRHVSRYCEQTEALYGSLTVEETLSYAAAFNLPSSTPETKKQDIIESCLKEFGLTDVRNTILGTPLIKGCSGGQVRRVSVSSQVIGLRNGILFLDEPTSGLDTVAAESVITSLRNLVEIDGATIIVTIHQPSTETFELFTHLLLLGQGSTVYFGTREGAIPYFESIGHPIPFRSNPSDIYLRLTNVDFVVDQQEGKDRVQSLVEAFKRSTQHQETICQIDELKQEPWSKKGSDPKDESYDYVNGFFYQTMTLVSRILRNSVKNPLAYWVRLIMCCCLAILMGTTWIRMETDQSTVTDRLQGLFFGMAFLSFMAVSGIPAFLEEELVVRREVANGLYSVFAYLVSNTLVSLPFLLIITLCFSAIAYWSMGLQESLEKFGLFNLYFFLALNVAESQTLFISVLIPIFVAALAVTSFVNGLWMVAQGSFVQKKNLPSFYRNTFHVIDFQKYAFELLVDNEFRGLTFQCDPINSEDPSPLELGSGSGGTDDPMMMEEGQQDCFCIIPSANNTSSGLCEFNGEDALRYFEYDGVRVLDWMLVLLAIALVFRIATYLTLKFRTRRIYR